MAASLSAGRCGCGSTSAAEAGVTVFVGPSEVLLGSLESRRSEPVAAEASLPPHPLRDSSFESTDCPAGLMDGEESENGEKRGSPGTSTIGEPVLSPASVPESCDGARSNALPSSTRGSNALRSMERRRGPENVKISLSPEVVMSYDGGVQGSSRTGLF